MSPGDTLGVHLSSVEAVSDARVLVVAQTGGGSDGVIAKRLDVPYQGGNRDGMQYIKRIRSSE